MRYTPSLGTGIRWLSRIRGVSAHVAATSHTWLESECLIPPFLVNDSGCEELTAGLIPSRGDEDHTIRSSLSYPHDERRGQDRRYADNIVRMCVCDFHGL